MVKRIGRRFVSLLLTFVTILTLLPAMTLPALAAPPTMPAALDSLTFTDLSTTGFPYAEDIKTSIGINDDRFTGGATISGTAITITATGTDNGRCSNKNATVTLTLTNSHATTATLTFTKDEHVKVVKGVGESSVSGSIATIPSDGSIEVSVTSKAGTQVSGTFTVTGLEFEVKTLTTTFLSGENGSYTIRTDADEELTTDVEYTKPSTVRYRLEPKPDAGYAFDRWIDFDTKETLSTSSAYETSGGGRIAPVFAPIGCARYYIAGASKIEYSYLDEAIAAAGTSGTIVAASDGTVFGSKGQKTFTIPSGVTLLIPYDETGTVYTEKPAATRSATTATPFRTPTMKAGSSITLASGAAISVGGQYFAPAGGDNGKMVGHYGCIKMESGSAITVQNGASLYAWGFISGSGSVTVQSGGSVYEWYQIMDFRGGSASTDMGNKVFPFNQYAVQNIEVPLTVYAGASETVYTALYAVKKINSTSISFIGDKGLFKLTSGSLTKAYDGKTDRMIYTIDGNAELNGLKLSLFAIFNIDSKDYVMPLTNNMTIDLNSGSKLTMNQTAALLPGVELSIAKNAELVVPDGQSMYIYDVDEWGKYCGHGGSSSTFIPVVNAPGRNGKRARLEDVKVDVNGKLTAIGGIYTTNSGANICSSEDGGRYVQQGAPGTETLTYQYDGGTNRHDIPITPAQLQNKDGSYTKTSTASASDTFTYCKCQECGGGTWVKNLKVAEFSATKYGTLQDAANAAEGAPYVSLLHSTTEDINAQNDLYLDLNGCTVTGYFTMNGHTLYGMDSTTDGYDGRTAGKIVGGASFYKNIYQTGNVGDDTYKRYVAIQGKEKDTSTLSFHRFNISVTGYRFELKAPECALFFIGKFQGDKAAKNHLTKLGFTLTDIDKTEKKYGCTITGKTIPLMPTGGGTSTSEVVQDAEGAYFFEAYLMRSFDKSNPAAYRTKISATAQATFDNGGKQDSKPKLWSFEDAWTNPGELDPAQQEILKKFFNEFGINIQVE